MADPMGNPAKCRETALRVRRTMRISEIIALCPPAANLMAEEGLRCFSCSIAGAETLEEGCRMHGLDDSAVDELVAEINAMLASAPQRPQTLTIMREAASAIHEIALREGRAGEGLTVAIDARGGFCLEFSETPAEEDRVFCHSDFPDIRIFASPLTLGRIGGATIAVREGNFTLDLPGRTPMCGCGGGPCHCCGCSQHGGSDIQSAT